MKEEKANFQDKIYGQSVGKQYCRINKLLYSNKLPFFSLLHFYPNEDLERMKNDDGEGGKKFTYVVCSRLQINLTVSYTSKGALVLFPLMFFNFPRLLGWINYVFFPPLFPLPLSTHIITPLPLHLAAPKAPLPS